MDEGGTQGKRMRKRWVSSLLPSIKWQDERKKQRGAALAYRYLWSWKRCHCILLIYFFFPINLSHQFLKMCKYLATREILSFSLFFLFFFLCEFFCSFWGCHLLFPCQNSQYLLFCLSCFAWKRRCWMNSHSLSEATQDPADLCHSPAVSFSGMMKPNLFTHSLQSDCSTSLIIPITFSYIISNFIQFCWRQGNWEGTQ